MNLSQTCKQCSIRGYSPELCALHNKMLQEENFMQVQRWWSATWGRRAIGKALAVGACAGALTSALGLSAACFVGLKGLAETVLAAKVITGGGIAGAVTSVTLKKGKNGQGSAGSKKRKHFVPPLYLNER